MSDVTNSVISYFCEMSVSKINTLVVIRVPTFTFK
jgi:hypothetical protein